MKQEYLDIVNENGDVIGQAVRSECHNGSKLLHRVIHIHIINSQNRLLLQKRKQNREIQPGKWDTAIGGHVLAGETINEAIIREAKEETGIGIDLNKLIMLKTYIHESAVEREYIHSFIYIYDGPLNHSSKEIDELEYFSAAELNKIIKLEKTTPNFNIEYNYLKDNLIFFNN